MCRRTVHLSYSGERICNGICSSSYFLQCFLPGMDRGRHARAHEGDKVPTQPGGLEFSTPDVNFFNTANSV